MLVDTHAHLNFDTLATDLDQVITNLKQAEVETIINVGTDLKESQKSIDLAAKYDFIYATCGIHPTDTPDINIEEQLIELAELAHSPKIVAIGECGLDFYREPNPAEHTRQTQLFEGQIKIAKEQNLPVVIHSRQAWKETLEVIKQTGQKRGLFHCWTYGPEETAEALKETAFYFALNGILTFNNAKDLQESARMVPLERLVLETDSPFLTPVPHRGLRNEPAFVTLVAQKVSELKDVGYTEIAQTTTDNAQKFFNL
jgi:TatD DNase family protein